MKILLVEDHIPTRNQIKTLIGWEPDLVVVADVGSAEEAIQEARRLRPDVVVMDIALAGMSGIDATRRITSELAGTRVLALSNHTGQALVKAVLEAGGLGYVSKNRASEDLVLAIRAVAEGKQYIGHDAA